MIARKSSGQTKRSAVDEGFYRAFEDRYRGSRELIRSRLEVYRPFLEPLKSLEPKPRAVDLGCGRGEWLELLSDCGFAATGVDLDDGMLAACRERGLDAVKADAIAFMEKLGDETQAVVSGFHLAEHLPFLQLQALVRNALRVMQPGGLLILETPNPENLKVASLTFYLDPTHRHPLPPELLSFLPHYYGFTRVKVIRLQERPELRNSTSASLRDVLAGASPDYAVLAQKGGDAFLLSLFDELWGAGFGLEADELTRRFDSRDAERDVELHVLHGRLDSERDSVAWRLAATAAELEAKLAAAEEMQSAKLAASEMAQKDGLAATEESLGRTIAATAAELEAKLAAAGEMQSGKLAVSEVALRRTVAAAEEAVRLTLAAMEGALEQKLAAIQAEMQQMLQAVEAPLQQKLAERDTELRSVYSSWSWKMSRPLRKLEKLGRGLSGFLKYPRRATKNAVVRYCRRPHRKARLLKLVRPVPPLRRRVLKIIDDYNANAGPSGTDPELGQITDGYNANAGQVGTDPEVGQPPHRDSVPGRPPHSDAALRNYRRLLQARSQATILTIKTT
jgi:O-antigen chain-terminating methyltransferase